MRNAMPLQTADRMFITYSSRCEGEESTAGKGEVVARVEAVPEGRECVGEHSAVVLVPIVHHHPQPDVSPLVPVLDRLLQTCAKLLTHC